MIAVIQRISEGSVTVEGKKIATSGLGFLILLGVAMGVEKKDADLLADKIAKLRVFEDDNGKMNRSVVDVGGSVIVVSNFTLLANYRHGNRPDFISAAKPTEANELYEYFKQKLAPQVPALSSGEFGADMKVSIINDGPITLVLDSAVLREGKK